MFVGELKIYVDVFVVVVLNGLEKVFLFVDDMVGMDYLVMMMILVLEVKEGFIVVELMGYGERI